MLVVSIAMGNAPQAQADYWGAAQAAAVAKQVMEKVARQVEGVLNASLKAAAVEVINRQISDLVGGSTKGPLFITNWEDFIHRTARQQASVVMNDFLLQTTRGKYSMANYVGVGDVNSVARSYLGNIIQQARLATVEPPAPPTYDLDAAVPSPEAIFKDGDWRGLNAMFANPANNEYGLTLMARRFYEGEVSKNIDLLTAEAIANKGFASVRKDDAVITPGSTIADVVSSAKTLPDRIIAATGNPSEFLGGVIISAMNRTMTSLINQGIGKVQSKISREAGAVGGATGRYVADQFMRNGAGAAVSDTVKQEAAIKIRSYTNPANYGYYDP